MNTDLIKDLREKTGAGIMACKSALESTNGDIEQAMKILQEQGIASARKKIGRNAQEGIISSYIHANNKIGVLLELNCETDFVANTDDFKNLAHNITMQIAEMNPIYIDMDSNPKKIDDENPNKDNSLLSQQFIKDNEKSIKDLIEETSGKLGEKIEVKRFQRFSI